MFTGGLQVLVVDADDTRGAEAATTLRARHRVRQASLRDAASEVEHNPPDVLVYFWPAQAGVAMLHTLCEADRRRQMYVVVVLDDETERGVGAALLAGAHDIVRARYFTAEACFRVSRGRPSVPRTTSEIVVESRRTVLAELRAWRYLPNVFADELENMLGAPIVVAPAHPSSASRPIGAMMTLSLPTERHEFRLYISAEPESLRLLGNRLFGGDALREDAMRDLLREMTNSVGGAFKRAALSERTKITMGLPTDQIVTSEAMKPCCWSLELEDGSSLMIHGEIVARENKCVPATTLHEGMVVAKDLLGRSGMLLVAAGTRLTLMSATQLAKMLGGGSMVEIADAV